MPDNSSFMTAKEALCQLHIPFGEYHIRIMEGVQNLSESTLESLQAKDTVLESSFLKERISSPLTVNDVIRNNMRYIVFFIYSMTNIVQYLIHGTVTDRVFPDRLNSNSLYISPSRSGVAAQTLETVP